MSFTWNFCLLTLSAAFWAKSCSFSNERLIRSVYNEMINTCRCKDLRIKVMPSPLNNRLHGTGHFLSSRFLLFDMFTLTHSSLRVLRNFILPYQVTVPSLRTFVMPFPTKSLLTAAELALLMTPWHSPYQFLQVTSYHRPLPLSTKPSSCSCTR